MIAKITDISSWSSTHCNFWERKDFNWHTFTSDKHIVLLTLYLPLNTNWPVATITIYFLCDLLKRCDDKTHIWRVVHSMIQKNQQDLNSKLKISPKRRNMKWKTTGTEILFWWDSKFCWHKFKLRWSNAIN